MKIIAEMFGCFTEILYLCNVIQEWITKGGKRLADGFSCIVSNTMKNI